MLPEEFRGFYQHAMDSIHTSNSMLQFDASIGEMVTAESEPSAASSLYDILARAGVLRK